jgi:hypothetical protein
MAAAGFMQHFLISSARQDAAQAATGNSVYGVLVR